MQGLLHVQHYTFGGTTLVIVTIRDNGNHIRVPLYSEHAAMKGWGVHLTNAREGLGFRPLPGCRRPSSPCFRAAEFIVPLK